MATIVATEEIMLTCMIIFDKVQFTLSAIKEHKTPANIYQVDVVPSYNIVIM